MPDPPTFLIFLSSPLLSAGDEPKKSLTLRENNLVADPGVSDLRFHAVLGDTDQAFAWLEKMYQERNYMLHNLKVAPEFVSLRDNPRFTDLLRRIGLEP